MEERMTTICGIGSLLSERSAKGTCRGLRNFRLGRLKGFRRLFNVPAPQCLEHGVSSAEKKDYAVLAVWPLEAKEGSGSIHDASNDSAVGDEGFIVSLFDIPESDLPQFYEREQAYNIIRAPVAELDGKRTSVTALLCCASTDEKLKDELGDHHPKLQLMEKWGIRSIWNNQEPVFPCSPYLRHCILAVRRLGPQVESDFLKKTFLWDRKTTVGEYFRRHPEVMDALPVGELKHLYNG